MKIYRFIACLALAMMLSLPIAKVADAAQGPVQSYEQAKASLTKLVRNPKADRADWKKLSQEFLDIYTKNPTWANRMASLFRAGVVWDTASRQAGNKNSKQDAEEAIKLYARLVKEHPQSVLADDALYNQARLEAELLKNVESARKTLEAQLQAYPKGDLAAKAISYQNRLKSGKAPAPPASAIPPSLSSRARLTQIGWETKQNVVRIILDCDAAVAWTVRSRPEDTKLGSPSRLIVDLTETTPDRDIRPGVKIADSPLNRVRLDLSAAGTTRVLLDFSDIKRFTVTQSTNPFRLIITASTSGDLPKGLKLGQYAQSKEPVKPKTSTLSPNLAAQLGLSVNTIILDAGHGGKDPGTSHNNVVEREVVLDLTKRVGALLARQGFKVHYTRTNDSWVALEARSRRANEVKADLLVSIHVNANLNPSISGFETYYLNFASSSEASRLAVLENAMSERTMNEMEGLLVDLMLSARTQESHRLAGSIQKNTLSLLKKNKYDTKDGGTKSGPFHVLLGSSMPGVLIEVGYCSNKVEAKRLLSKAYLNTLAEGIVKGIVSYTGQ